MAVVLFRSAAEKELNPPPAEQQVRLPSIVVKSKPVRAGSSHVGKKVAARCAWQYGCAEPRREQVWRSDYDRRKVQLSWCGFNGPPHKAYRDMGGVTLDDERLILDGLGQSKQAEEEGEAMKEVQRTTPPSEEQQVAPSYQQLRARTPSQFPTELVPLESRVREGNFKLELIRRGTGMFRLLEEAKHDKMLEATRKKETELEEQKRAWQEGGVSRLTELGGRGEVAGPSPLANSEVHNQDPSDLVEQWYQQLCVLLWVLQAMCMEKVEHMAPLSQCWRVGGPTPSEQTGCRHWELQKQLMHKWQHSIQQPLSQKNARKHWSTSIHKVSTARKVSQLWPGSPEPPSQQDSQLHTPPTTAARKTPPQTSHKQQTTEPDFSKQKKLTRLQMNNLLSMLEDELNWSRKQSRSRVNALMADQARGAKLPPPPVKTLPVPKVSLDVSRVQQKFADTGEELAMVVHEQLSGMDRQRVKSLQQKFSLLKVSGNEVRDLTAMRQGVEIESTTMAKRKLLMNYNWYEELVTGLPEVVKGERYCCQRLVQLKDMAADMVTMGPGKMSRRRLVAVLSRLRPWELESPPVKSAAEFITERVIYIVREDYQRWLEQHSLTHTVKHKYM